jgi:hypothetical protein
LSFSNTTKTAKIFLLILLAGIIAAGCRKEYVHQHFDLKFVNISHYTYSDINGYYFDTTDQFNNTVSLFPESPEAYEYGIRKTVPIKIQKDVSNNYLQTAISHSGKFNDDPSLHGGFSGGYTDNDHFSYTLKDRGLGSHYKYDVHAKLAEAKALICAERVFTDSISLSIFRICLPGNSLTFAGRL